MPSLETWRCSNTTSAPLGPSIPSALATRLAANTTSTVTGTNRVIAAALCKGRAAAYRRRSLLSRGDGRINKPAERCQSGTRPGWAMSARRVACGVECGADRVGQGGGALLGGGVRAVAPLGGVVELGQLAEVVC